MRRLSVLLILLLTVAACSTTSDDQTDDATDPTPTSAVDETQPNATQTPEPTSTPEPTPTPTPEPEEEISAELQAFVDEVTENVAELRGLELQEDLQFATMSRDDLTEMLEDEVDLSQSDIDLYWVMRLIDDRDIDLEQMLIDVQAADIYGFYDPETKETYVISEDEELGALEEVFLAHEITHALQDQHFGLERMMDQDDRDYDAQNTFLAIVEGDAVLTQELYAQQYLGSEGLMEYQQEAMAALQDDEMDELMEEIPPYVIESLSFPYIAGPMFMLQAYDGDLNSIDQFLEDPPTSTQQILNPQAYQQGEIDDPVAVELPDLLEQLDDGWDLWDEGTFGVFNLSFMLEMNGIAEPDDALESWAGDGFAMYQDGEDVISILATRWDEDVHAGEFEDVLRETMTEYTEENGIYSGDGRYHAIDVDGDLVTLMSASSDEALASVR